MQIQSKALPQSFSFRRALRHLTVQAGMSHPLLVFAAVVLFTLFAIAEVDLHTAQLQALGLLGHGAGLDPVFMGP